MVKFQVYKGWNGSRYHVQYSTPELEANEEFTKFPYVDTVKEARRGLALRTIINKIIIKDKPATRLRTPYYYRGRHTEDERFEYQITLEESKLFSMLFRLTRFSWGYKIWEEIARMEPEEIQNKIVLMSIVKGKDGL